jgi:hypothetical protein
MFLRRGGTKKADLGKWNGALVQVRLKSDGSVTGPDNYPRKEINCTRSLSWATARKKTNHIGIVFASVEYYILAWPGPLG